MRSDNVELLSDCAPKSSFSWIMLVDPCASNPCRFVFLAKLRKRSRTRVLILRRCLRVSFLAKRPFFRHLETRRHGRRRGSRCKMFLTAGGIRDRLLVPVE